MPLLSDSILTPDTKNIKIKTEYTVKDTHVYVEPENQRCISFLDNTVFETARPGETLGLMKGHSSISKEASTVTASRDMA